MQINIRLKFFICLLLISLLLTSCSSGISPDPTASDKAIRLSEPLILLPAASDIEVFGNEFVTLDISNKSDGYIMAFYEGFSEKVKLQIIGPDEITYTYNLETEFDAFPLTAGNGSYIVEIYENISNSEYIPIFYHEFEVQLDNENAPFLRPNQLVSYDEKTDAVLIAKELAEKCSSDLEVVSNVYNWIINNIRYDENKATNIKSGYIPDINETIKNGYGVCFDFSVLMAAMLRTQSIPTKLQIGYLEGRYHAWISVYIKDVGWINGIIQFDGKSWKLLDPTFANSSHHFETNEYQIKYIY